MLVLTRKTGEQIVIAGNITISVVSVGPGRVKIGIEAPPHVTIDRQEVHAKKAHEEATSVNIADLSAMIASETDTLSPRAPQTLHNRVKAHRDANRARPIVDKPR